MILCKINFNNESKISTFKKTGLQPFAMKFELWMKIQLKLCEYGVRRGTSSENVSGKRKL